jgi:peptidoglycan/LPS O-acetylase OafA/YrhL
VTLQRQTNFEHIEGLRGYLAVWVAVGHGLQLSGFLSLPKPFSILLQGDAAVAVFMTVSGFVIAHLLTVKQEAYRPYLIRRFFRLYPAYVLACFAGFLLLPLWSSIVTQAPWSSQSGWAEYRASVQTIEDQSYGNFLPHFPAHLTMLHGLIPNQILPKAPLTFLPAAWSISLEWQDSVRQGGVELGVGPGRHDQAALGVI